MIRSLSTRLLLMVVLFSCQPQKENSQTIPSSQQVINLKPSALNKLIHSEEVLLLDVRTPREIAGGKIAGALELDYYHPDFLQKIANLPKNKPLILYCAVGARSREAAELLTQTSKERIYHLDGGIQAWITKGFPVHNISE